MKPTRPIELIPFRDFPIVRQSDNIAKQITDALDRDDLRLIDGDILVIAQKVVSKAEGRFVNLADVRPSEQALTLARGCLKDPRLVETVLNESTQVLRCMPNLLVVVHRLGFVIANAGVDASNVTDSSEELVLLLPENPDQSAADIRGEIHRLCGVAPGVIINDSFGRAWRQGTIGTAIGAAGVPSFEDLRGHPDLFGRTLIATEVATADQIASAASLLQGQADEGIPVVLVRGFQSRSPHNSAATLVRPPDRDAFR